MIDIIDNVGKIRIASLNYSADPDAYITTWEGRTEIKYTKYQIKESDFRIKTATFTSPSYIDLTCGVYFVLISSKYHENFSGVILDVEYDEDTGLYNYQCQDWSRRFTEKYSMMHSGKKSLYNILIYLITRRQINAYAKKKVIYNYTKAQKDKFKKELSGLKALWKYDQSLYDGNKYKGNPLKKKPKLYIKDKTYIEMIRSLIYGQLGFFDIWFNDKGIIQIEPISKKDWESTGLHLTTENAMKQKYKFSTTNAITTVHVNGNNTEGKNYDMSNLKSGKTLDLSAFFGRVGTSINDPSEKDKNTSNSVTTNTNKTTTVTNKDNPYGNKKKKIWIGADGGSGSFTKQIVKELQKNGWSCHYSGEGAGVHSRDYKQVTSDYQILAIVDNGFCCTTIKEAYEASYVAPILKKKGVTVMFMFDTRSWNNARGMKPFKYGDFGNHVFHTAWDDPSGYCKTMNATAFFKKHKAVYCASPTAKGMVDMFLKGGYFASKGIKV